MAYTTYYVKVSEFLGGRSEVYSRVTSAAPTESTHSFTYSSVVEMTYLEMRVASFGWQMLTQVKTGSGLRHYLEGRESSEETRWAEALARFRKFMRDVETRVD